MNSTIKIFRKPNSTKIEITPKPTMIWVMGTMVFYVLPFLILTAMLIYIAYGFGFTWLLIMPLLVILAFIYFILKNLRRLFEQEVIILQKNQVTMYKQYIWVSKKRDFERASILDLGYIGYKKFTHNSDFDHIGRDLANKDIEWLSADGNLSFFYKGSIIRFGRDLYEEDAQRILAVWEFKNQSVLEVA